MEHRMEIACDLADCLPSGGACGVETVFGSDVVSNDVTKHPRQALLSSAVLDYAAALA